MLKFLTCCYGVFAFVCLAAFLLARSSPPWITVDRPFLFLIRHNVTGKVFFFFFLLHLDLSLEADQVCASYCTPVQSHLCDTSSF